MILVSLTVFQINIHETRPSAYASSGNQTTNVYNEPPLKQFKAGVPLWMIACKSGLIPIQKISNHTPACVTEKTYKILIQRGWGTFIPIPPHPGGPPAAFGLSVINKTK